MAKLVRETKKQKAACRHDALVTRFSRCCLLSELPGFFPLILLSSPSLDFNMLAIITLASLTLLSTLVLAQDDLASFPCDRQTCAQQGQPDMECVQASNGNRYCGWSGALCTSTAQVCHPPSLWLNRLIAWSVRRRLLL